MKLLYKINILLTALTMVACEDFLVEEPITEESELSVYADPTTARYGVNGVYEPFHWGQTTAISASFSHSYEFIYGDICSDDSEKGSSNVDQSGIQDLKDFIANGASSNISATYEIPFVVIARANMAINNLEMSPIDEELRVQLIAESRFLRGLAYFQLVRIHGGMPIFSDAPAIADIIDRNIKRSSISETYAFIDADLEFAMENLVTKESTEYVGYANSGAASAFLARSYMYQIGTDNGNAHTWQEVFEITNDFISGEYGSYSLVSNYATIFELEGENNEESIWEIQMVDNGIGVDGTSNIGPALGSQWSVFNNPLFMGGWGFNTPTENLADSYEVNDPRRPATAIAVGEFAYGEEMEASIRNNTGYYNRKMITDPNDLDLWRTEKGSGVNIRKYRYADILLMNAEAAYHVGNTAQAISRLEEIRNRASQSTYPKGWTVADPAGYESTGFAALDNSIIPSSGQPLLDFIYLERRRELGMEQLRFWDLVRTGRFVNVMDAQYGTRGNILDHSINAGGDVVNDIPLFPIPTLEVSQWGLEQNKNY